MLAVMGGHQGVVKAQPVAALLFFKESIEGRRLLSASSLHRVPTNMWICCLHKDKGWE